MIGIGDGLQQHGFAGARGSHDQSALALADGRQQVHHASRVIVLGGLHLQPRLRIERRQVVEEDLVAGFLGRLEVDRVDLDQREVPLAFLGRADLAADRVAGAQIEAPDLRGRDVHVVGPGQIVVLGRAQESESVGQAFEHAFGENQAALGRLLLEDLEDQLLLAQSRVALDAQVLGDLVELLDAHVLELHQVERAAVLAQVALGAAPVVEHPPARLRRRLRLFCFGGGRFRRLPPRARRRRCRLGFGSAGAALASGAGLARLGGLGFGRSFGFALGSAAALSAALALLRPPSGLPSGLAVSCGAGSGF